jgi:hypothetical protein
MNGKRNPPTPSPRPAAGPRLDSQARVRRELARVYGDCRAGRMAWGDGTKAAHVLSCIARILEGAELEARVAKLEAEPGDRA